MINILIRSAIIYISVIAAVRLMGKRQIGELQPSELVITILLSEIASIPIQDDDYPLFLCFLSVILLITLEILFSVISLKHRSFRNILQGNSVMVINNGKIIHKHIKSIRYSVEDLIEALRLKDVFDISQVQYAYIETNGSISIQLKPEYRPVTMSDMNKKTKYEALPCLVISDGQIIEKEFDLCNMSSKKICSILQKKHLKLEDVLVMTADSNGKLFIAKKDGELL